MDFHDAVDGAGKAVDAAGVAVMIAGAVIAAAYFAWRASRRADEDVTYHKLRRDLGRAILLGLEFLVAGDIIRTVAARPTFTSVGVLAIIVGIRTFLSFSLELEVTGRWPWEHRDGPDSG